MMKRRSLKANARNPALRAIRYFRVLTYEAQKIVMEWAEEEMKAGKQKARECARLEHYHEAEHWRAIAVFAEQIKCLLARSS